MYSTYTVILSSISLSLHLLLPCQFFVNFSFLQKLTDANNTRLYLQQDYLLQRLSIVVQRGNSSAVLGTILGCADSIDSFFSN